MITFQWDGVDGKALPDLAHLHCLRLRLAEAEALWAQADARITAHATREATQVCCFCAKVHRESQSHASNPRFHHHYLNQAINN